MVDPQVRLAIRRQRARPRVGDGPVGVPLHVRDARVLREGPVEHRCLELAHVGPQRVECELVAMLSWRATVAQHPVGMGVVQLRDGVDHLGFEPDAEADPPVDGRLRERSESRRQLHRVAVPVAQAGRVVVAGERRAEPAVVEQEQLGADVRTAVDQLDDAGLVEVEERRLPVVRHDRPHPLRVAQHPVKGPAVEPRRDRAAPRRRPDPRDGRCHEPGARIEHVVRGHRVGARSQTQLARTIECGVRAHVDVETDVAAPRDRQPEHVAPVLAGGSERGHQQARVALQVRLQSTEARQRRQPVGERVGRPLPLVGPAAPAELAQLGIRCDDHERCDRVVVEEAHRRGFVVHDLDPLLEHRRGRVGAQMVLDGEGELLVDAGDDHVLAVLHRSIERVER